jgi:hypothetical protein
MDVQLISPEELVVYSLIACATTAFGSVAKLDAAISSENAQLSRAEKIAISAIIACRTVDPETFWTAWAMVKVSPESFEEGIAHGIRLSMQDAID